MSLILVKYLTYGNTQENKETHNSARPNVYVFVHFCYVLYCICQNDPVPGVKKIFCRSSIEQNNSQAYSIHRNIREICSLLGWVGSE